MASVINNQELFKNNLNYALQICESTCNETSAVILGRADIELRVNQLKLLRDCAEACTSTAIIYCYKSIFTREQVELCGKFCQACGAECLDFQDRESQKCAKVCLVTAKKCREYVQ